MSSLPTLSDVPEAGEPGPPPPWWRRRNFLIVTAIVVILGITIVTDLPQNATAGVQYHTDASVMHFINGDVAPCSYAVGEAFMIHHRQLAGSLTPGEKAQVPKLLEDDRIACTLIDQSIYNLSDAQVPGSTSGRYLQDMVGTVETWAIRDSLLAVKSIQTLWSHPKDPVAAASLRRAEQLMTKDRAAAEADIAAASRVVKHKIPPARLKVAP